LKKSLKPGGIICSQVGSIWIKEDQDTMIKLSKDCNANFKKVTLATISIPSYPTGNISFIMATDNEVNVHVMYFIDSNIIKYIIYNYFISCVISES